MIKRLALLLLSTTGLYAADLHPPASILFEADTAYAQRNDEAKAKMALATYEKAAFLDPSSVEALWKASRAAYWVGDHATSRDEKLTYFQKGIDMAKQALSRNPDAVEAHFWLGVNEGAYGDSRGVMKSLFLVKPIRHEMEEVNRLNAHYSGGGGYRVLGVVDYKVPGIAGGNKKRALNELQQALALDATNPFTHYYLAEYYKVTGDKAKARMELDTLGHLQVATDLQPELQMMQIKGETLRASL